MKYKNYRAHIEYSEEDVCLIGHITGITDIIGFRGDTIPEIREAFEEAVDDYIETCQRLNKQPQQPCSGDLQLRIPPDIHAGIVRAAEASGKNIDQWAIDTFSHALGGHPQVGVAHNPDKYSKLLMEDI